MPTERRVLSSLELLPEECRDDVVWALARLNERERTQADILFELNDRLAVKGQGPISKSAFSRRSVRLKRRRDRIEERDHTYAGIADQLTPEKIGDADTILGEYLKTLIDDLSDGVKTSKEALELSSAYRQVVAAQSASLDRKKKADADTDAKLAKVVDKVGKAKGLSADTIADIKAGILGIAKA